MSGWQRFWNQPTKAHRNSQLFFAVFTVGFAVAACLYAALPGYIAQQFAAWDARLGGSTVGYPEPQCRIWISLAAANVATLSVMCSLLVRDIHRYAAVHFPLLFMKSTSAALFVLWWLARPEARFLLIAALGDFATGWGIWHFARRAWAERREQGETGTVSILQAVAR